MLNSLIMHCTHFTINATAQKNSVCRGKRVLLIEYEELTWERSLKYGVSEWDAENYIVASQL
jgi:hypothetical protein